MNEPSDPPAKRGRGRPRKAPYRRRVDPIGPDEAARAPTDAAVWELVRARYSREARELGDAAARTCSLADLVALEVASHEALDAAASRVEPDNQERVALIGLKLQSRKALRALTLALGPARRKQSDREGFDLPPDLREGTPEFTRAFARLSLHEQVGGDEILD